MTLLDDAPTSTSPVPQQPAPAPAPPARQEAIGRWARSALSSLMWAAIGFLVVLAIWAFGASRVPQLPKPGETLSTLKLMLENPFYDNGPNDKGVGLLLASSLQSVFIGFVLATIVGAPIGLAMGSSKKVWAAANPVIQVLRPVSPLAWFPIWLVVFKDSHNASVWVIFITSLWPTLLNTAAGAADIPHDQRDVARVFRFGKLAYLRHVLLPNTLPSTVTGMRLSMGIAWMVIVAVEMLAGGGRGIGGYVWEQYNALKLDTMVAAILIIGVTGYILDLAFLRLGRKVAIQEVTA
jgi:nitrate/nitrite transport system permease protein